jgi:tetratricopeptide (TPR) repeat protein
LETLAFAIGRRPTLTNLGRCRRSYFEWVVYRTATMRRTTPIIPQCALDADATRAWPPFIQKRSWRNLLLLGLLLLSVTILAAGVRWLTWAGPLGTAQQAFQNHDYRAALRDAQNHLNRWPHDRQASLLAARCLSRLGQHALAESHYRNSGPLKLADLHDRAFGLARSGDAPGAARIYEQLLDESPNDVLALKRLAAVLMEQKAWKKAGLIATRLIGVPGGEIAGYTLAGIVAHVSQNAVEAAAAFEQVIKLDPKLEQMALPRARFWSDFAFDLIGLGRTEEARSFLIQALAEDQDPGFMELLGLACEREGALDEAERWWRKALELDPDNADTLIELGRLALGRRQWDEAVRHLERASELSPQALQPVYGLSRAYRFKGDRAKAEQYEERAIELRRALPQRGGMGAMPADPETESIPTQQQTSHRRRTGP